MIVSNQPEESTPPCCVALIICNEIIEDKRTSNKALIGLFNTIRAPDFPTVHPRMFVMASLTGGVGTSVIAIEIRCPEGSALAGAGGEVSFKDADQVVDLVFEVNGLGLPAPGKYEVSVLCDVRGKEKKLMSRTFSVVE